MKASKDITVYGTGKGKMEANKAYIVSDVQASKLIAKGVASIKPQSKKQ